MDIDYKHLPDKSKVTLTYKVKGDSELGKVDSTKRLNSLAHKSEKDLQQFVQGHKKSCHKLYN